MALKTNFTDDILAESMNGKRQYNITENSNGTKSLEDVTDYQSVGSTFSAKDMNETNEAVNQAYEDIGDEFNPEVDYAVGDYAIYNNKVWKFTTAHPAGAWDESHVKRTTILSENRELTENLIVKPGAFASTNTSLVSPLGTQIVLQVGNLAIVHLRLRLTTSLNKDAHLGTITPHPSAEAYNLLFLNQQDNTTSSVYIDTSGKVVLGANAPAGFYVLDTAYAIS